MESSVKIYAGITKVGAGVWESLGQILISDPFTSVRGLAF